MAAEKLLSRPWSTLGLTSDYRTNAGLSLADSGDHLNSVDLTATLESDERASVQDQPIELTYRGGSRKGAVTDPYGNATFRVPRPVSGRVDYFAQFQGRVDPGEIVLDSQGASYIVYQGLPVVAQSKGSISVPALDFKTNPKAVVEQSVLAQLLGGGDVGLAAFSVLVIFFFFGAVVAVAKKSKLGGLAMFIPLIVLAGSIYWTVHQSRPISDPVFRQSDYRGTPLSLRPTRILAGSTLAPDCDGCDYAAANLFDGHPATAWITAQNSGPGVTLTLTFKRAVWITNVKVTDGWQSGLYFDDNGRADSVALLSDGGRDIPIPLNEDQRGTQPHNLLANPVIAQTIVLRWDSVTGGFYSFAISDLSLEGYTANDSDARAAARLRAPT